MKKDYVILSDTTINWLCLNVEQYLNAWFYLVWWVSVIQTAFWQKHYQALTKSIS